MDNQTPVGPESAIAIFVPEADEVIEMIWSSFHPSADKGIAAHITINYPFIVSESDVRTTADRLSSVLSVFRAFYITLTELRRWPTLLYLKPEPVHVFQAMIAAVWKAFPQSPPYAGKYSEVVPHLTLIESTASGEIENIEPKLRLKLEGILPIKARVEELDWIAKVDEEWRTVAKIKLPT
jgi:2'-5' RNA ligase